MRWVLAVPEARRSRSVKDLEGKIIATELVGATKRYLAANGVKAKVEFSWGATEVKPPDAGRRHRRSHRDRLVAARQQAAHRRDGAGIEHAAHRERRSLGGRVEAAKLEDIKMLLEGAINALGKVGLMLNVRSE